MFDLTGKVAVVTGGTGALGAAFVRGLAGAGADVAILARALSRRQRSPLNCKARDADRSASPPMC